jgi:hypothetical protein
MEVLRDAANNPLSAIFLLSLVTGLILRKLWQVHSRLQQKSE